MSSSKLRSLFKLCMKFCLGITIPQGILPTEIIEKIEMLRARRIMMFFIYKIIDFKVHYSFEVRCKDGKTISNSVTRENLFAILEKEEPKIEFVQHECARLTKKIKKFEELIARLNKHFANNLEIYKNKKEIMNDFVSDFLDYSNKRLVKNPCPIDFRSLAI